jgi:hypothetical protein
MVSANREFTTDFFFIYIYERINKLYMKLGSKFNEIFSIHGPFLFRWLAALCLFSCLLFAMAGTPVSPKTPARQSWKGYLIDLLCAQERTKERDLGQQHTSKCLKMPACDRSGFGILLEDNRVLKFDQSGNTKARKLLQNAYSAKIKIRISGTISAGDIVRIDKIDLSN